MTVLKFNIVLLLLLCAHKNKAASYDETACKVCPRNRGEIALAGADDGTLCYALIPLPNHVLVPQVQRYVILLNVQ